MPFWKRKKDEPEPPANWMIPRATPMPVEPRYSPPVSQPAPIPEIKQAVTFHDNGDISLNVGSVPEAKLAIKQLRLRKKEIGVEKKAITTEMAEIRADRRQQVANQGPMMRGGGGFGKTVRTFESLGRANARAKHANRLAPYDDAKAELDRRIMLVDRAIHSLEAYVLEQTGKAEDE